MAFASSRDEGLGRLTASAAATRPAPAWALAVCYIVFPLSSYLAELMGVALWRNWIDVAWLLTGLYAAVAGPSGYPRGRPRLKVGPGLALCVVAAVWLAWGALAGRAPQVTAAMEAKPLFYLLIALLLTRSFILPSPRMFCRFGSALAIILLVETIVRSALAGAIVRPVGSGEVNYDAALLCLSLVFALSRRELARIYGPLIFLGLLASFSRTSLLAACGVLLFANTVPATVRLLMVGAAAAAGIMSFAIRDLEVGVLEAMDRYWMWAVGLEYLVSHAWSHAAGVVPGAAVDVEVPGFIADLWLVQQENLNVEGIFPFHFHAMWLRLAISWGWAVPLLLVLWLGYQAFLRRFRPPIARSYFIVFLVLGLTMGLIYLGNVAVPYLLALNALLLDAKLRGRFARGRSRVSHSAKYRPPTLAPSR
ncbi:hypothetical protein [Azohydromonas sediminis]|uniref:hypothetical protein n=1 Tax=Azohydromonas sediminis TaxID=2259674 RepID=UPI000E659F30|nr:hypothetical protein [Azohydromonas sediminis]